MGHRMKVWVGSRIVSTTWDRVGIPVYQTSTATVGKSPLVALPLVAAETADLASPLSLRIVDEEDVEPPSPLGTMKGPKGDPILKSILIRSPSLHIRNGTEIARRVVVTSAHETTTVDDDDDDDVVLTVLSDSVVGPMAVMTEHKDWKV